jgi:hypothetical protein
VEKTTVCLEYHVVVENLESMMRRASAFYHAYKVEVGHLWPSVLGLSRQSVSIGIGRETVGQFCE